MSARPLRWLGLPRFRGRSVIWESGTDDATAFSPSSHIEAFFGSAPGGAILPSRPALWCGCRAQFAFQRGEEALAHGIVIGVAHRTSNSTMRASCANSSAIIASFESWVSASRSTDSLESAYRSHVKQNLDRTTVTPATATTQPANPDLAATWAVTNLQHLARLMSSSDRQDGVPVFLPSGMARRSANVAAPASIREPLQ